MASPNAIDPSALLGGSRPALARAVTLIENDRPGAQQLLAQIAPHRGRAHVVGITGAPGAGKSTLINALLGELTHRGKQVAVIAVDPSSPVSGGSILGDRVRMHEHDLGERIFIRSLSARGHVGGLSRATAEVIDVVDAAGFDVVIVETVGTGQSEVEIGRLADTRIVVCPPGLGDEVQALKAGILEIADVLVVSKADLPAAERTVLELRHRPGYRHRDDAWEVPVLRVVATTGQGVAELVDVMERHVEFAGRGRRLRSPGESAGAVQQRRAPTPPATDDELFATIGTWRAANKRVALATVVRTWGSSPRPEGSYLAIAEDGAFVGSVSGGCIEGAVIGEATDIINDGKPRLLEFGVSDEQAWEVGLACGGRVQVFVERIE